MTSLFLQAKEAELTRTMDQFLQEKVSCARVQGELSAVRGRLERVQSEVEGLRRELSRLREGGEVGEGEVGELCTIICHVCIVFLLTAAGPCSCSQYLRQASHQPSSPPAAGSHHC